MTILRHASLPATESTFGRADWESYLDKGRPYSDYSRFVLETLYKSCLRSFSKDVTSPSRLLLDDIVAEFALRGALRPVDASTSDCINRLRRVASELVADSQAAA